MKNFRLRKILEEFIKSKHINERISKGDKKLDNLVKFYLF